MILKLFVFLLVFIALPLPASTSFGPAYTGATSGRAVPSLYLAQGWTQITVSFFSTGVATPVYYQNSYQLGVLKNWGPKDFLWGKLEPAIGIAALFSRRAYVPPGGTEEVRDDWTAGPDIKATFYFGGPFFLTIEVLFGLKQPQNLLYLAPQDEANMAIGITL
jgi:hypothetical protein